MAYTITTDAAQLKVSKAFIDTCTLYKDMIEDCGDDENLELPFIEDDDRKLVDFEKVYNIFQKMTEFKIHETNIVDYLQHHFEEYKAEYPMKNIDPPFYNDLRELSNTYTDQEIKRVVLTCNYLGNDALIRSIAMIVGLKIREMSDYDEKCRVVKDLRIRLGQLNPDEEDVEEEKKAQTRK